MRIVLILLYILTTPPKFEWSDTFEQRHIEIQSIYKLNESKTTNVINTYEKASHLFFNEFEKDAPTCMLSDLNIKIVSPSILNDRKRFNDYISQREVFGRYYWKYNALYITEEAFEHPEYLAHELAHYFYDECGMYRGTEEEEQNAYKFQGLYLKTYR